ncbi:MAG: endonuclease [Vicingaceae bacterium]
MKNKIQGLLFVFVVTSSFLFAQQPYYNNVNLTLTGMALKSELSQKIINTHTSLLSYSNVWTALKQTDLNPSNSNDVLLLYGYNDSDNNPTTDRTRSKNDNGGNTGDWNREHTYPKSLATPSMTTNTPNAGTDAHHLRATDEQMNNNRASKKFAAGSGNAGNTGGNWYPGDEWKGDVARMMMYMYLRYPSQCPPNDVGVGTAVAIDPEMITLFLDWNAQDAVSLYEKNRNSDLETRQGNRNPFIDNPYLATLIWGGTVAEDFWNMTTSINENNAANNFSIYPIPSKDGKIQVHFKGNEIVNTIQIYSIGGKLLKSYTNPLVNNNELIIDGFISGFYILKADVNGVLITKKVVIN